jgi:hypothetical protein
MMRRRDMAFGLVLWFVLNPLAMLSPGTLNLGLVTHFCMTLVFYLAVMGKEGILNDFASGISLYVDPTLVFPFMAIRIIIATVNKQGTLAPLKSVLLWALTFGNLLLLSGSSQDDIRNYLNILFVKDHSENLGFFWYIFVEVSN